MSKKSDSNSETREELEIPARRTALKSIGGAFGIGTFGSITSTASAAHTPPSGGGGGYSELDSEEYIWKESDSTIVYDDQTAHGGPYTYKGVFSASVMYLGVQESPYEGEYEHYFDGSSCFTIYRDSRYDNDGYQRVSQVGLTDITIDNNATETAAILASNNDDDVGAHPSPASESDADGSDWGDAAYTVISAAVSEINDKVNYAATAFEIADALVADAEYSAPSGRREFDWRYDFGNEPAEANNCVRFIMSNKNAHETIDFDIRFGASSNADSALNPALSWNVQEDATDHV